MVSGTSGSFVGGVTHAAGYVVGNGTTGYFGADTTIGTLGISGANAMIFVGIYESTATAAALHGLRGASTQRFYIGGVSSTSYSFRCPVTSTGDDIIIARAPGVLVGGSENTNSRYLVYNAGTSTSTVTSAIVLPDIAPYFLAANNAGSGAVWHSNEKCGFYGVGVAPSSQAVSEQFHASLRTLWETCTGLTLP
jgi:hypothetical protein